MGQSDSSLTPEQQLLKLIEAQGGKQQPKAASVPAPVTPAANTGSAKKVEPLPSMASAPSATASKKDQPVGEQYQTKRKEIQNVLSLSSIRGRLSNVQEQWTYFIKGQREALRLKRFVNLAKAGTAITGLLLAIGLTYDVLNARSEYSSYFGIQQQDRAEVPSSKIRTFGSDFFERVKEANVFAPSDKRADAAGGQNVGADGTSFQLVEMTKDLKLTGISYDPDDPKRTYCMIEDLKKAITNFLKVGDSISGLTVSGIDTEGVTLKFNEEEIKIR